MRLHHVGIVVDSIERCGVSYGEQLKLRPLTPIIADPFQRVQVQFWADSGGARIELIEPMGVDSPVQRFLEKGGGLNHLCFEVEEINTVVEQARAKGAVCVSGPVAAAAFDGLQIAFLFFKDIGLVELKEAPTS